MNFKSPVRNDSSLCDFEISKTIYAVVNEIYFSLKNNYAFDHITCGKNVTNIGLFEEILKIFFNDIFSRRPLICSQ